MKRVDECRDAEEERSPHVGGAPRGQVDISVDELIDELGHDGVADALEQHAAEHAVAIEPVRLAAEVLVLERVAAVADVLAAGELGGELTVEGAWRQRERAVDGGKVALEVS